MPRVTRGPRSAVKDRPGRLRLLLRRQKRLLRPAGWVAFAAVVVLLGLIFFSASINKLPGYVLPLIPATCALLGIALAGTARPERWLIAPVFLLGAFPLVALVTQRSVEELGFAAGSPVTAHFKATAPHLLRHAKS